MTLYGTISLSIMNLDWNDVFLFIFLAVLYIVIILYMIYVNNVKNRCLSKTEKIVMAICMSMSLIVIIIMRAENVDWNDTFPYLFLFVAGTIIGLYQIYINDIKKR